MEKNYASLELCKLAKERGFNWSVRDYYFKDGKINFDTRQFINWNDKKYENHEIVSAITYCDLHKWVEEISDYVININFEIQLFNCSYTIYIKMMDDSEIWFEEISYKAGFETREKAFESGFFELFNIWK